MVLACVLLVVCGLLMFLSVVFGYRLCERRLSRVCPLFRQSFYCSGNGQGMKAGYLNWLRALFDCDAKLVTIVIHKYPNELQSRVAGWVADDSVMCGGESIDKNMLYRYLSVLEVCSQFQICGIITYSMFWENYEHRLRDILSCKELYLSIANERALCGLKAALAEAQKRVREEEAEELLPD